MSQYARLEKNGKTVMYLTPVEGINEVLKNQLFAADRSKGKGTIAKDKRVYRNEITIQGTFVPSSNMPPAHRAAVQTLYSRSTVSAIEQWRWLRALALSVGGQFDLRLGSDAYTATSEDKLNYDIDGDTLPQVVIDEVRRAEDTKQTRIAYTLRLIAGFQSSSGES